MENNDDVHCTAYNTINMSEADVSRMVWSDTDELTIKVIIPCIVSIGVFANTAFLYTVSKVSTMQTLSNFYLCTLAVLDITFLMYTTVYYPTLYTNSSLKNNFPFHSNVGCIMFHMIQYFTFYCSLFNVTIVSLERYYGICHPLRNRRIESRSKIKVSVIVALTASVLSCAFHMTRFATLQVFCLIWPDSSDQSFGTNTGVLRVCQALSPSWFMGVISYSVILYFILLFINIFSYIRIIVTLHKRPALQDSSQGSTSEQATNMRNQVARVLIINGCIFFLCNLLNRLIQVEYILGKLFNVRMIRSPSLYFSLLTVSNALLLMNSTINPFIYGFSSKLYREAFVKAFFIAVGYSRENGSTSSSRRQENSSQMKDLSKN